MSASISDEQTAARELVRSWAPASGAIAAARAVEQGDTDAWLKPFSGLAELGFFGVAVPESLSGAGGGVADLCAMLEEAAYALVPGPVTTTALATLLLDDEQVLGELMSGQRSAGVALDGDLRYESGQVSGTLPVVLGARPGEYVIAPAGSQWLLIDTGSAGATVEPLTPTDFSRPLARVVLDSVPAAAPDVATQRVEDLAATVLAAEATGLARWMLDTATEYAKVREQFGKPIGSFQAIKHLCAEMLLRSEQASVAAADAARAASDRLRFAAFHRRRCRRSRRDRGREGQREGLHSGARRYRHHLGARRAPVSAPGACYFAVPRRQVPVAAPCRGTDPRRCAP